MKTNGKLCIQLNSVGVYYLKRSGFFRRERYWAINDLNLSILEGETVGILGRNGAGKSTLLRLLANIITPDRGSITRPNGISAILLSIQAGFVMSLTGRENIFLSGLTLGLKMHTIRSSLDEIIAFSELENFIDQPVGSYSTGMRARLGFAVAIQVNPDVLLIDEIISVGDRKFNQKAFSVIENRVKDNRTSVIVTHNEQLVSSLCTRAIWIDNGRIAHMGDTDSVIEKYIS